MGLFEEVNVNGGGPRKGRHPGKGLNPETRDGYDVDEFYTRRTDQRGLDKELRVGIAPGWHYLAHALKEEFPAYRTVADLMRDALVHRLHYLQENIDSPTLKAKVEVALAQSRLEARRQELDDMQRLIKDGEEALRRGIEMEDWGDVEYKIDALRVAANSMPPVLSAQARSLADTYEGKIPR